MSTEQKKSSLALLLIILTVAVIMFVPKLWQEKKVSEVVNTQMAQPLTPDERQEIERVMAERSEGRVPPTTSELEEIKRVMENN